MKKLRIEVDVKNKDGVFEKQHFDIPDFDIKKANKIGDPDYSLYIGKQIKNGLSKLFKSDVYALPVYNLEPSDFSLKLAGGEARCMGEGNMNDGTIIFDAKLID